MHAANSACIGHFGDPPDCLVNPLNRAGRCRRIVVRDMVEDVRELVGCRHRPANFHAFTRTVLDGFVFSWIQASIILPTSSSSIRSPFLDASKPSSIMATKRLCSLR